MKAAMVGCGDLARAHIPFILKDSRHQIIGLYDEDLAKAEALAKTADARKVYRTLEDLLQHQKPDVVHVLTPPQSHAALAMSALRAGCHVLVEKPMAPLVEGLRRTFDWYLDERRR